MKNKFYLIASLLLLLLQSSCSDEEVPPVNPNEGLLSKVEHFANDEPLGETIDLTYDERQHLASISCIKTGYSISDIEIKYENDQIESLMISQNFIATGNQSENIFTVSAENGTIQLMDATTNDKYTITASNGYIDSYKSYLDVDNDYYYETIFSRDIDNNIDTITYYVTNQSETNRLAWQYTFSNFENEVELNSAFNPVFNYAQSFYNPFIGLALDLKIPKQPPLKSSYLDGNGTFREAHISAEVSKVENNLLKEFDYLVLDLPSNTYRHSFEYL